MNNAIFQHFGSEVYGSLVTGFQPNICWSLLKGCDSLTFVIRYMYIKCETMDFLIETYETYLTLAAG